MATETKVKTVFAIAIIAVVVGIAGYTQVTDSDLRKAFIHHQGHEYAEVKAYYGIAGGESFVMSERWKNYQKYAKDCPAIAEVVQVEVSKTTDGGEFVIRLYGPSHHTKKDGFEADVCSLWAKGATPNARLEVRDFTSY